MAFADFLNQSAVIYSQTVSADDMAGMVLGRSVRASGVAVRSQRNGSSQSDRNGAKEIVTSHTVFTSYALVENGDTMVITLPSGDPVNVRVVGIEQRSVLGGIDTYFVLRCEEIVL